MTSIDFYKYQATGNDFILIDNRDPQLELTKEEIIHLCDRKFGIGSDGLILIQNHEEYDFEMVFYNPDSSQSLCGNGSRCAVNFAKFLGIIDSTTHFLAFDGVHFAEILDNGEVRLKMSDVQNVRLMGDGIFVDTGSPHLIKYVINIDNFRVYEEGKAIRNGGLFKAAGVNVNFVEITGADQIFVRTYERGVENETLSCGTGVTAAALASSTKELNSPVKVNTKGGNLSVEFEKNEDMSFSNVYLLGPAKEVFKGSIELDK
ncbi:diaminopimelate epimerase [Fulvivirga sediminis]|uniref:Diaminopimelate epimerase n=1 Tax=Fulvivirga sediminis TaxID=2803949 RepID=A0A937F6F4_9BACT|nr:diaminopimelate epimerase [Fulvivirga sediminis]MBL3654943.1 diaminopimelate epimerase [Fulvivirga sediminis]